MNGTEYEDNLEVIVRDSLGCFTPLSADQIDTVSNASKYSISENDRDAGSSSLEDVFGYMAALNKMAVSGNGICADRSGNASLHDGLISTADYISHKVNGASVRYIEIGPEPYKTELIIKRLIGNGVDLTSYIGLDINPESEKAMRLALEPVVGKQRFSYKINDYNELQSSSFGFHDGITVVTMMGFQEGNELPRKMLRILKKLTSKGDLLLSEMQLSSLAGWKPIIDFYSLQPMKQFSQKICERAQLKPAGQHRIFLTPIETELGPVMTAATVIPYKLFDHHRYLLTNCCLKYTKDQFRAARKKENDFQIVKEFFSGDQTVAYQLTLRN
tara:strand:- start:847 stop:1836 length:990 start_codon:yes stop_codon:yes gene_type:complete